MLATIQDCTIQKTKEGNPSVALRFMCEDSKVRTWYGSLKEGKAREITIDTLLRCGFTGEDPLELAEGIGSGLLDTEKKLELVVAEETYEGKTRERVQWVNEVGGQGFQNQMSKAEAVQTFKGMNLKADLAARRKLMPTKKKDDEPVF